MADKKLNEVPKVTDMAYVPVVMADGSIGQIAKADLASVVAGQLPNGTLGIRRLIGNINPGDSYVLTGFRNGLYIYQNTSASHDLGMALVDQDGTTSVLREISHFKTTETSGVLYMKRTSNTDMTIYNNYPSVQGFVVLYIGRDV